MKAIILIQHASRKTTSSVINYFIFIKGDVTTIETGVSFILMGGDINDKL